MKTPKQYETEGSYRLTDEYLDFLLDVRREDSSTYRPEEGNRDIGPGSWILIRDEVPIAQGARPGLAALYYATPTLFGTSVGYREDGAYLIAIKVQDSSGTIHNVNLYPREYIVVNEELLQGLFDEDLLIPMPYKDQTQSLSDKQTDTTKADHWRKRYSELAEDDRNIIDAFMLDGLSFDQSCSMYFVQRYSNNPGSQLWYAPKPELRYLFWD